ncbi:MAG: CHASE domain-containing protein, partial [Chloroflexi bacterium]|nr:CHASE domain-containing protein [Chloroflexota bacterium]
MPNNASRPVLRYSVELLLTAAAYYVAGRLGLLLAIPPGYATAIWPPSGIALAAVLLAGHRVWPGILLGSFLVNVGTSFDAAGLLSLLKSLLLPLVIATGATLQALLGGFLVGRLAGFPNLLNREAKVVRFLGLGGPVSCLVAPTLGVSSLFLAGVIPAASYPFSWWTWWVGDTIGVLIVTPMALIWLAKPREVWRQRRLTVTVPLAVAFAVTVVVFVLASAREQQAGRLEFERRADTLTNALVENFNDYVDLLSSIKGFYASSSEVERPEFHTFVELALDRQPGVQVLAWIPHVPGPLRAGYETAARQEGYPGFQITEQDRQGRIVPAAARAEYFPIYYLEPYAGNEPALGFDVASDPARLEALTRARDTGRPTATGPVILVQETGDQPGFLILTPVYGNGLPQATVAERRQNLQGFVSGAFRVGDIVAAALAGLEQERAGLELRLYDESAP